VESKLIAQEEEVDKDIKLATAYDDLVDADSLAQKHQAAS